MESHRFGFQSVYIFQLDLIVPLLDLRYELLRRLLEKEEHIRELRSNFATSEEDKSEENIDKYAWAMDNHARAVDRIRILEQRLKQKETDARLTATRFVNLQTKYNEKEKELAKLQGRYDKVVMNGLPASPRTQNAMKDLRQSID